jgi:hypothetical protein
MGEASLAQTVKNAALLSPCHIQNSRRGALAVQFFAAANLWTLADLLADVLDLFSRRVTFQS